MTRGFDNTTKGFGDHDKSNRSHQHKKVESNKDSIIQEEAMLSKERQQELKIIEERQIIKQDVYQIPINNPIFYHKLGKYPQVMELFRLIGFRKVTRQINTALKYMRDPTSAEDLATIWAPKPESEFERELTRISDSRRINKRMERGLGNLNLQ